MGYKRFSEEEIAICQNTDLVNVCETLGYRVKKVGRFYQLAAHDSFVISNRKRYNWYSKGNHGSSIDFLMLMENKTWKESIEWLLNFNGIEHLPGQDNIYTDHNDGWFHVDSDQIGNVIITKKEKSFAKNQATEIQEEHIPFSLPDEVAPEKVKRYLVNERKISEEIVDIMIEKGLVRESKEKHNAVFVGYDSQGIPRHASVRGIYNMPGGNAFKGVVTGSDGRYSFSIANPGSTILEVFEAPIDAISYFELYDNQPDVEGYNYLALTGVHDRALDEFLKDHPYIDTICLALDHDPAGDAGAEKIKEKYTTGEWEKRKLKIYREIVPDDHKDWNEYLAALKEQEEKLSEGQAMIS